ncbi:MAG TPA: PA14 domain-containing protein [Capsulimonadaceae bacterium]|jgi:hypothetical protein
MKLRYFLVAILGLLFSTQAPANAGTGGGYTAAGLRGEYFANGAMSGPPAFVRRDVRIRFFGPYSVAGSNSPVFKAFPMSGWSARWTGQLMPRFSEPYTISVASTDAVRVSTKNPSTIAWTPLLDNWVSTPHAVSTLTAVLQCVAGKPIDIKIEYRDIAGPAALTVSWKSASTPDEIIEPVQQNGLNTATYRSYLLADCARLGRDTWLRNIAMDAAGNPKEDGEYVVWEGKDAEYLGTYKVTFKGKADISIGMRFATFESGGKQVDVLPSGTGYDPATNTTTALMRVKTPNILFFRIKNSQPTADAPVGTGITDLHIYRPSEPGGEAAQAMNTVVNAAFKPAAEKYTVLRFLGVANGFESPKPTWADRTLPSNHLFCSAGGENWETLIELANETGKDLYLATPVNADNDYLEKLAQLLQYGSDGVNPYTSPQSNPVYPPLNSNLCVYFEIGNEIWNWGFPSSRQARTQATAEIDANTNEAKIFNYDGKGNYRTWLTLRTIRASEIFRRVMGDKGFGLRFRPLVEYQYNNYQVTAYSSFRFIDAYFNNGDGDHVATPHPVGYYLWGAGGATYYGVGNNDGIQNDLKLADGSFETATIPDGSELKSPTGSGWTFSGDAGIYRLNSKAYVAPVSVAVATIPANRAAGMKFRTGARPLIVKQFGRFARPNTILGDFVLLRESDKSVIARASGGNIQVAYLAHWNDDFYYADAKSAQGDVAITLEANTEYILVVAAGQVGLQSRDSQAQLSGSPDVQVEGGVTADCVGDAPSKWQWKDGQAGAHSVGLVTFAFRTSATVSPDLAIVLDGQQAGILRGSGSISQVVNFTKPGNYALQFHSAGPGKGGPGSPPFSIACDDQSASPQGQADWRASAGNATLGGFARDLTSLREEWGSAVFSVKTAGPHMIRFESKGKPEQWMAIDDVKFASVDAIMDSGFGAGSAYGQIAANDYQKQLNSQASYALTFGLHVVAYEAGWSLGGDFTAKPIQTFSKYMDPRAKTINNAAGDIFAASGGELNCWGVYTYWPPYDLTHPENYPLMQSIDDLSNRLPAPATNGVPLPAVLTPVNAVPWGASKGNFAARGEWASWIVNAARDGNYSLNVTATAGARYDVEIDGVKLAPRNGTYTVLMTRGAHGIRVRSTDVGQWSLTSIGIQ